MPRRKRKTQEPQQREAMRCAVYTRKSTSEGLDQAFNTLDAQREACEAYVASQKHEGWRVLPHHYDDGGFSGGTIERPAMQQLLADIEAGKIDCVVVYKVDRLSRSLLDFARIMKLFEDKLVHFVSVTQHFNTADSMGRLTLNILLSFAQFEREIIGERTRDKIAAARRKGKYVGGWPILGYDVDKQNHRLVVNPEEAEQVRAIFRLYIKHQSLIRVGQEANRLEWQTKAWTTSKGKSLGGKPFDKAKVHYLLTNVAYLGKVRYREEVHEGEHEAIVEQSIWDQVQSILVGNARTAGAIIRNKHGALLKGLLKCKACGVAMIHSVANRGSRQYRYYVCTKAQKRGHAICPTRSVNASAIERALLERLRQLPIDHRALAASPIAEAAKLFDAAGTAEPTGEESLSTQGQARLIRLLVDRVEYDGRTRQLAIIFTDEVSACVKASA